MGLEIRRPVESAAGFVVIVAAPVDDGSRWTGIARCYSLPALLVSRTHTTLACLNVQCANAQQCPRRNVQCPESNMQSPAAHSPDGFGDGWPEGVSTAGERFDFLENIEGMAALVAVWSCSCAGCAKVRGGAAVPGTIRTAHSHTHAQLRTKGQQWRRQWRSIDRNQSLAVHFPPTRTRLLQVINMRPTTFAPSAQPARAGELSEPWKGISGSALRVPGLV
jgi:hypothetical protein